MTHGPPLNGIHSSLSLEYIPSQSRATSVLPLLLDAQFIPASITASVTVVIIAGPFSATFPSNVEDIIIADPAGRL